MARHGQTCHQVSRPMLTFCDFLLASGCRHLVWVPGGRHTSHTVRARGLSLWNISEKKEVQCTRAGIRIHYRAPTPQKWDHRLTSKSVLLLLVCLCADVMSPRAEPVHSRHPSLCEATHWEGKMWPGAEADSGKRESSHNSVRHLLPEWRREGGGGYHGQRAPSSGKICLWDFPTDAAVNQVGHHVFLILGLFK